MNDAIFTLFLGLKDRLVPAFRLLAYAMLQVPIATFRTKTPQCARRSAFGNSNGGPAIRNSAKRWMCTRSAFHSLTTKTMIFVGSSYTQLHGPTKGWSWWLKVGVVPKKGNQVPIGCGSRAILVVGCNLGICKIAAKEDHAE